MSKKKKHTDLQPMIDYLRMLHTYEQKGFLELKPEKHEAYITEPALLTLVPGLVLTPDEAVYPASGSSDLGETVSRLHMACAWRMANVIGQQHPADMAKPEEPLSPIPEAELTAYLRQPFALHVVDSEPPHDLRYALLLTTKQNWLGRWKEKIEFISYMS